jgi:membrane-associated phospholipid phosphatase
MPTSDLPLLLSLVLLVVVPPASALPPLARRAGWANPAVRRTVRVGVGVGVVLLIAQLVVVGWVEAAGGRTWLDERVLTWFVEHRNGWASGFAIVLAWAGGTAAMTVLALTAALALAYLGQWRQASVIIGASGGAGLMVLGFKNLYDRQRPPRLDQVIHYQGHALPSGHALGSIVVIGVVTAVLLPALSRPARAPLLAGAAVLVLGIGWCRLYLAAHWLTDVLVGWLLGGAWLAFALTALALLGPGAGAGSVGAAPDVPQQHVVPRQPRPQ